MQQISISIVTYAQDGAELNQCLQALVESASFAIGCGEISRCQVYLIDNGPTASNGRMLTEISTSWAGRYPWLSVRTLGTGENVGFGRGHNLVLNQSLGTYHVISNADVVVSPGLVGELINRLEHHPNEVMAVPVGENEAGEPLYLAKRYPALAVLLIRALGLQEKVPAVLQRKAKAYCYADGAPASQPAPVEIASGCFMCIRASAFTKVGGFDPRFFLYFEDFDLSIRLRELGTIIQLPIPILHRGGNAAHKGWWHTRLFIRSAVTFFSKHGWRIF